MSKCPLCGSKVTYMGANEVECEGPECPNFNGVVEEERDENKRPTIPWRPRGGFYDFLTFTAEQKRAVLPDTSGSTTSKDMDAFLKHLGLVNLEGVLCKIQESDVIIRLTNGFMEHELLCKLPDWYRQKNFRRFF